MKKILPLACVCIIICSCASWGNNDNSSKLTNPAVTKNSGTTNNHPYNSVSYAKYGDYEGNEIDSPNIGSHDASNQVFGYPGGSQI